MRVVFFLLSFVVATMGCSDFFMNFTSSSIKLSGRTMDLGGLFNFTLTSWPRGSSLPSHLEDTYKSNFGVLAITANWFGDKRYGFPSFFADSLNEKGLSCGLQTLVGTQYQERSLIKENIFAGDFCFWAAKQFSSVEEVQSALSKASIWGPDAVAQHFILHDATGKGLIVELVGGKQHVYLDSNDGISGFGITTNEPTLDWHLDNVRHYEWKRTLARQAVPVPGSWYPEERFLRIHMVKQGMASLMNTVTDFKTAFSLTSQVLNTVTVPMGDGQYGTDSGETSGEGNGDHSIFGIIRDHQTPALYWRDATNPSFRRISLKDLNFEVGAPRTSMIMETGPFFIDMAAQMK